MPDGFVPLGAVLIGVDIDDLVQLAVEVDLRLAAGGEVGPGDHGPGPHEGHRGLGALLAAGPQGSRVPAALGARGPVALPRPARIVDADAFDGRAVVIPERQPRGLGGLRLYDEPVPLDAPAFPPDQRDGPLLGALDDGAEGVVREPELLVRDGGDAGLPLVGNALVAQHDSQDAGRAGRVAVGVLPAAGADAHGLADIAVPVQQAPARCRPR